MALKDNLVEQRVKKGWTKKEAAKICGISATYYGDLENEVYKNPSFKKLKLLADGFGTTVSELTK